MEGKGQENCESFRGWEWRCEQMSGFVFGKERYIKQKFNVGWFSEHVPVFSVRWIDYR